MDDKARHCISLLSGHAGGANFYTSQLALVTGADPVITTASDLEGRFAVDVFARENGLIVANWKTAKFISVEILSNKTVTFISDFPVEGELPKGLSETDDDPERMKILVTDRKEGPGNDQCLKLIVPDLVLGIGCRKETPQEMIEAAVSEFLKEQKLDLRAVCEIASIDLKAEEPGLLGFAEKHRIPFETYSAEELSSLKGEFASSEFVESVTGVSNVCERSVVMAGAELIAGKTKYPQVTVAAGRIKKTISF